MGTKIKKVTLVIIVAAIFWQCHAKANGRGLYRHKNFSSSQLRGQKVTLLVSPTIQFHKNAMALGIDVADTFRELFTNRDKFVKLYADSLAARMNATKNFGPISIHPQKGPDVVLRSAGFTPEAVKAAGKFFDGIEAPYIIYVREISITQTWGPSGGGHGGASSSPVYFDIASRMEIWDTKTRNRVLEFQSFAREVWDPLTRSNGAMKTAFGHNLGVAVAQLSGSTYSR